MGQRSISDDFRGIVRITELCSDICGLNIFDPRFHVNWRTCILFIILNMSMAFMFYTAIHGYVVEGDWKIILQVCSIGSGTLIQGYAKVFVYIWQKEKARYLLNELRSIYGEYELKSSDYKLCLSKGVRFLANLMRLCLFVNILLVFGMAVVTLATAFISGTRILVVQCVMPGLDAYSDNGYILTIFLQVSFILVGGFGFYAGDMAFFTPICQIMMQKDLLICKFHDLNEIVGVQDHNKKDSLHALKDIIEFHQRYLRFLLVTENAFFWVVFIQMCTYATGISCTLFCLLLGNWPAGYIYLIYCFVMMYVYCGIGTFIEISNDEVINACYSEVLWYNLSLSEQKILKYMLTMTQNTGGLTVGGVVPLTMNTGLKITKTVYSVAMMLISFLD